MAESRIISNLSRSATVDDIDNTSVLAIETVGETYQVEMSVLSPAIIRELFDNYHIRLTAQDIASADHEFDFTVYESGGASKKAAGFRITCPVINGDGSNKGTFATALNFVDKLENDIGAATFYLYGNSFVTFEYDPDNSQWVLIEDGREPVYVHYKENDGFAGTSVPVPYKTKIKDNYNIVTTGASWKATVPRTGWYTISASIPNNPGVAALIYVNGSEVARGMPQATNNVEAAITATIYLTAGQYVDIRNGNTASRTVTYFTLIENKR